MSISSTLPLVRPAISTVVRPNEKQVFCAVIKAFLFVSSDGMGTWFKIKSMALSTNIPVNSWLIISM